jgi:hypothetical protein
MASDSKNRMIEFQIISRLLDLLWSTRNFDSSALILRDLQSATFARAAGARRLTSDRNSMDHAPAPVQRRPKS